MAARSITLADARAEQLSLRTRITRVNRFSRIRLVAGVDVGFEQNNRVARGAVAVLTFPGLELTDSAVARCPVDFPYIPGYLSFRELPAILRALDRLHDQPDILLCDGQGIAHPRRIGLASRLLQGVATLSWGRHDCKDAGGTTPWTGEVERRLEPKPTTPGTEEVG